MKTFDVNAWIGEWPFRALKDSTPESLVTRMDVGGIAAAAVSPIHAAFHRHPRLANEQLAEAVGPYVERLLPMATINPHSPGWERDLRACHEEFGMRGVRLVPVYHGVDVDGAEARAVVSACAERSLPVSIPFRMEDEREHHWMDPGESISLNDVANLVEAVPDATIIVPNARGFIGSALWTRAELRERRWFVDTSLTEFLYGLHWTRDHANPADGFFGSGGEGHLMFGTHMPLSYAGSALVKLETLPLDDAERGKVAWGNAAEVFGLGE